MSSLKHENKLIQRGSSSSPTPFSRSVFVFFRALDLPLQYSIISSRALAAPLIRELGGASIPPTGRPLYLLGTNTGLSPQRAILFGMAIGSVVKQSHWAMFISREPMPTGASAAVGVFNAFSNAINMILFTNAATSALAYPTVDGDETKLSVPTLVGLGMYALGMVLEWGSELQRLRFKKNPINKGRVYSGGLFGLARHINYGGYVLWRGGFALAAAGWTWGAIVGGFHIWNFVSSSIPELDEYCSNRYNEQWAQYKRAVPYKLFPFIL
ncbi:hypothetical protein GGU11DRAFT_472461 [Lentinula aff. detonsa]|uniref:Steroid 5-alpha reductase C-terminal domain-containing protein n=2 Tax=Lentinula TaxID=5352 RepID=A0AA38KX97_9AGAR|nr:hypothetical protein GGU10DRAFT_299285 [Lentinula aff. detonsa]KAJ3792725.1 hypothetical protein GGU11DRAFT_472461 [Lentinula aff. detonsa]KAJ3990209.1 hypothetical protein F5890DRAFT_709431 [Lentinula detonsa]